MDPRASEVNLFAMNLCMMSSTLVLVPCLLDDPNLDRVHPQAMIAGLIET